VDEKPALQAFLYQIGKSGEAGFLFVCCVFMFKE